MKRAADSFDYWKSMQERTGNIATQAPGPTNAIQINLGDDQLKRIIGD